MWLNKYSRHMSAICYLSGVHMVLKMSWYLSWRATKECRWIAFTAILDCTPLVLICNFLSFRKLIYWDLHIRQCVLCGYAFRSFLYLLVIIDDVMLQILRPTIISALNLYRYTTVYRYKLMTSCGSILKHAVPLLVTVQKVCCPLAPTTSLCRKKLHLDHYKFESNEEAKWVSIGDSIMWPNFKSRNCNIFKQVSQSCLYWFQSRQITSILFCIFWTFNWYNRPNLHLALRSPYGFRLMIWIFNVAFVIFLVLPMPWRLHRFCRKSLT